MSMPKANGRELTFGDAIKEALAEELRRDPALVEMQSRRPFQLVPAAAPLLHLDDPVRTGRQKLTYRRS